MLRPMDSLLTYKGVEAEADPEMGQGHGGSTARKAGGNL